MLTVLLPSNSEGMQYALATLCWCTVHERDNPTTNHNQYNELYTRFQSAALSQLDTTLFT